MAHAFLKKVRSLLSAPRVGQTLFLIAFSSVVTIAVMTFAVKKGYLNVTSLTETQESEEIIDAADDLADVAALDNEEEDDDEDSSSDEIVEVPEALRPEPALMDPFVNSMMGSLAIEGLFPEPSAIAQKPSMDRNHVLSDLDGRVSSEFKVPDGLRDRVGFWFDIYTKYDSNRRVIHHARFPWIIFKVVDVSMVINSDQPRKLWLRRVKADKIVKEELHKIRLALMRAATKPSRAKANEYDLLVAEALKPLGGKLRTQAALAAQAVRIQTGQRDFFSEGLRVSSRYLPTMEKIFVSKKLPMELTRIPLVESSFNKHATSKVGASGIWQFMGGTGRKFMLVDSNIDERRSPFKATEAAARLLKENHLILHRSWPLAVTAWNHGPGGIRKAAAKAGSRDLSKIVERYRSRSFDFASSNFYSEFLAALHAERYAEEMFGTLDRAPHVDLQAVKLARAVHVKEVLRALDMPVEDFLMMNPELTMATKRNLLLPKGFRLHIPEESLQGLEQLFALIGPVRPPLRGA